MKWILYCFGDEKIPARINYVYGISKEESSDYKSNFFGNDFCFGEIWSLAECRKAVKDKRFFSFRIK